MAYTGDSVLSLSLNVQTPKPLDVRTVVSTLDELYAIPSKYAYQGMTVAVISTGNLYMLIDKNKINDKSGWKASYESIQIIACTDSEYKSWKENTNDNYTPKDETIPYLYENTYYYIYEESIEDKKQYYVKYSDFEQWEQTLLDKPTKADLSLERARIDNILEQLSNYTTTKDLANTYATLDYVNSLIDLNNSESLLSSTLVKYYTKEEIDDTFVTLESLKGETTETDYIFVTQTQYKTDQDKIKAELESTLKTEEDGSVKNLTVEQITSSQENLIVQTKELYIGLNKVALTKDVPKILVMEQLVYDALKQNGELEEETYYFTYSDNQKDGVVTNESLQSNYYSKAQVNAAIYDALQQFNNDTVIPLINRIVALEQLNSPEV